LNSEVAQSVRIIKVINEHLTEQPECKCSIRDIMKEAIQE